LECFTPDDFFQYSTRSGAIQYPIVLKNWSDPRVVKYSSVSHSLVAPARAFVNDPKGPSASRRGERGVLRNHMILPDGRYRHSVFYSILDTEWPEVKERLEERLDR
jgi:hypothetical protein